MLCLGGVYAWSFFVPMMEKQLGFSHTQTQLIIGFNIGFFALAMVFTGRLEKRLGPIKMAFFSALFLFSGYKLAANSGGAFPVVFVCVSLLTGIGIAFGYVTCLVVPAKNFPERRGLAVGISVAGFGGGAIVLSRMASYFIQSQPGLAFLPLIDQIGNIYGLLGLLLFSGIRYPFVSERTPLFETPVSRRDKRFLILFFILFSVSFAGLLILSNLKTLVIKISGNESFAVYAISLFAAGNMLGRVFWGWFLDFAGPRRTFTAAILILVFSLFGFGFVQDLRIVELMIFGIALGYSFCFVTMPWLTHQVYGQERLGSIYPLVFLAYGLAGILGPIFSGLLFEFTGSFQFGVYISASVALLGLIAFGLNRKALVGTGSK